VCEREREREREKRVPKGREEMEKRAINCSVKALKGTGSTLHPNKLLNIHLAL
jgi:hypothetical protein